LSPTAVNTEIYTRSCDTNVPIAARRATSLQPQTHCLRDLVGAGETTPHSLPWPVIRFSLVNPLESRRATPTSSPWIRVANFRERMPAAVGVLLGSSRPSTRPWVVSADGVPGCERCHRQHHHTCDHGTLAAGGAGSPLAMVLKFPNRHHHALSADYIHGCERLILQHIQRDSCGGPRTLLCRQKVPFGCHVAQRSSATSRTAAAKTLAIPRQPLQNRLKESRR
jgi:hypothetical protein